jgi:hypothetical protein
MTTRIAPVEVQHEVGAVCDPSDASATGQVERVRTVAPRPGSLDGKVLAVIDNGFGGQMGLGVGQAVVRALCHVVDLADVVYIRKDAVNVPPRPEDWNEVCRRADVGLTLYGA